LAVDDAARPGVDTAGALDDAGEATGDIAVVAGELVLRASPNAEYSCDAAVWANVEVWWGSGLDRRLSVVFHELAGSFEQVLMRGELTGGITGSQTFVSALDVRAAHFGQKITTPVVLGKIENVPHDLPLHLLTLFQ
jgi:hypothetical protein